MEKPQESVFPAQSPVARFVRKLRRRSPLRAWLARRYQNATASSGAELLSALADPGTSDWNDRAMAYQALNAIELSPDECRRASQLLLHALTPTSLTDVLMSRLGRATVTAFKGSSVAFAFLAVLASISPWWPTDLTSFWDKMTLVSLSFCTFTGLLTPFAVPFCFVRLSALDRRRIKVAQQAAMAALIRVGEPEYVVALYQHIDSYSGIRPEALQTFRAILPAIDESWNGRLPSDAVRALTDMALSSDEELALAALDALGRAGDGVSAETVARIAEYPASDRVRERAVAVLPTLIARRECEAQAASLLPANEISLTEPPQGSGFLAHSGGAKLERKLRRSSPIRAWLKRRRENSEEDSSSALLRAVENPNASGWADRALAYRALGELDLSPQERTHASQLLLREFAPTGASVVSFPRIGTSVILASAVSFATVFCQQAWAQESPISSGSHGMIVLLLFLVVMPVEMVLTVPVFHSFLTLLDMRRTTIVRRVAATALAQVGGPECVVALSQYVCRRTAIHTEALQTLKTILPMIDASWYGRLPAGSSAALADLAGSSDEDLALAALEAIEQAGDGSCAKAVEHTSEWTTSNRVRERTAAVLPILIARRERESAAATLLRPSEADLTTHLLRPVYGADPEITNLLHASQAGNATAPDDSGQWPA